MRFLITGGAGFIGSSTVRRLIQSTSDEVLVIDQLTYAGNPMSLAPVLGDSRFQFLQADIADGVAMRAAMDRFEPDVVMHLAAETHVDRSIDDAGVFIRTNIVGTYALLEAALAYWRAIPQGRQENFRFHHISTDEVFGSLGLTGRFDETTPYSPNSPYAASKASSDHLVTAWHHTFGLPILVTNCSNNYGPYQFPEKLIPLTIINALEGKPLSVYGNGSNVRDWLHVDDHVDALLTVARHAAPGATYTIGGGEERSNLDVVQTICRLLDEVVPDQKIGSRSSLIEFVPDRPGHDLRYAIDSTKIRNAFGWRPRHNFESGIRDTVLWYLENRTWWRCIRSGVYRGERLGTGRTNLN